MGETAFVDGDAGDLEPVDQLRPQLHSDLVAVAAQRDLLVLEIVIGVARSDGADRGLDLNPDERLVVVDVEQRLRRVGHAPDHLRRHLDGFSRKSLTFMVSEMMLLARTESFVLPIHGQTQRSPAARSVPR